MKLKTLCLLLTCAMSFSFSIEAHAFFDFLWKKKSKYDIKNAENIDPRVLDLGIRAHQCALKLGVDHKDNLLTIIDYSKPSHKKRLWIVDLENKIVTSEQFVAHGSGSGERKSTMFSNSNGSHQTSIGVFRTAEPYEGKNGLSLRLDGLELGVNDQARNRDIVIHGANYVSDNFVKRYGKLGRSWGCPALDLEQTEATINTLKGGSLVIAYYPDRHWINGSQFLNCKDEV